MNELNRARLNDLITVMERVADDQRPFNMNTWQGGHQDTCRSCVTEEEALDCGTPACMAGWYAVSPEFRALPGNALSDITGAPLLDTVEIDPENQYPQEPTAGVLEGEDVIAYLLGISSVDAKALCGVGWVGRDLYLDNDNLSLCSIQNVTARQVLDVLYRLRDTGSVWPGAGPSTEV